MAQVQESPVVIDWTNCPLVEINPRKLSGVPVLKGTRMQADSIVENYKSGLPADEIAEVFELPADSVRDLLAYAMRRNPQPVKYDSNRSAVFAHQPETLRCPVLSKL